MHSTRHDHGEGPSHADASLPGQALDVIALTADAGLFATLRGASGPEHALVRAQSADAAVELLVSGRCDVLIGDLDVLRADAAAFFERLHAQFPELVLMAAARREEEGAVAGLVGGGVVFRLLHKPVSPARAGLFLTAAARRCYELRNVQPSAGGGVKHAAARTHFKKIIAAVVVVFVCVVAAFALWPSRDDAQLAPAQQPALTAAAQAEQIATLLGRAQIAYARDQLTEPRGDNALEHYRGVLALQPDHADAQAGVERVLMALEARVEEALKERNAPKAVSALAALQQAKPDHPHLDALRGALIRLSRSAAASSAAAARAQRSAPVPAPPAAPAQTPAARAAPPPVKPPSAASTGPSQQALQQIAQRRQRGELLTPPGANAYDALAALRAQFPKAEQIRAEERLLALALVEQTRTALASGALEDAALFLARAESLVPGGEATRALQQQLAAAQAQRAFRTNVAHAAALKRVREVAPVYPREAQRRGLEGWVEVEFTIATDGSTQDLAVRDALHREVFEKAALDSVRRWRFEPVMRDGQAVPQRAVLRVRFAVQ